MLRLLHTHTARLYDDTISFHRRPVYERLLRRAAYGDPGPATEEEKADAILLLEDPYQDALSVEAFRILDEYGR